jgi:RNA recognition motif-containing protein
MDIVLWFQVAGVSLACLLLGILVGRVGRAAGPRVGGDEGPVELYVGNLSYELSKKDLARVFQRYGDVRSVRIIVKKTNGQSKGFGFVEMADRRAADSAIEELNGKDLNGRPLVVSDARSRGKRRP